MKLSTAILLLLMPTLAVAQNYPGMSETDMQNMQKIMKMQSCIEKVDKEKLKAIEQRQYQFDAEVSSLCKKGKRDEAQKKALLFVKEMKNNPAIKAMSKCGEIAKGMMPDMPSMNEDEMDSNEHICDSI